MKRYFLLLGALLTLSFYAAAGPGFPGGGGSAPDGEVPIDGGASLLVGAAALYGVRKLRAKQNKDQ